MTGSKQDKNPAKVATGKAGGLAKAAKNKRKGSQASQKQIKRVKISTKVNTSPFSDTDMLDELDDSKPTTDNNSRRKQNMLDEQAASPLSKLNIVNTSSKNKHFPYIVIGKRLPLPITI